MLVQLIINGLVLGSVYALIALGLSLVYNTTKIFHISYTVVYTLAPYLVFYFDVMLGIDMILSILLAILLTILFSILIEKVIYSPLELRNSSLNVFLISSLGVMIIVTNLIALAFGGETRFIDHSNSEAYELGGIIITTKQLVQFFISGALIILTIVFLKKSKFGVRVRALRDSKDLSMAFGLKINRLRILIFGVSGLLAAIGGILISYDVGMDPYFGLPMFLNAIVALIIGGMGSFMAPVFGGLLLGLLQAVIIWKFDASWGEAISFILLIVFLIFKPQGLIGERLRIV